MHPHFWNWDSPVSDVLLHWWPWRDSWSPATMGPLTLAPAALATLLVPIPFSLEATYLCDILLGSREVKSLYWGGGGPVELLYSHTTTQSHLSREFLGGKQTVDPLDQWDCVVVWECRGSTILNFILASGPQTGSAWHIYGSILLQSV